MDWDSSICRVCLKSELGNIDLHDKIELNNIHTYLDLFNTCTHLGAKFDDLHPQNICRSCANDLVGFFEFLSRAIASDQYFKDSLGNDKENQFHLESEEYVDDSQTIDESSLVVEDVAIYKDEYVLPVEDSEYQSDTLIGDTFEIVKFEDEFSEDYDWKFEQNVEAELAIERVSAEESLNKPKSKGLVQGNNIVECDICGKILKQWSLKHHLRRCHKKDQMHLCSACPKTFTIHSDLRIHMKTHDTERKRSFKCTICRKGFYEKQALGVHMLRHTGVREFSCEICQKKFATKKNLENHVFTHNRQNGRFVCKYCNKRFPSRADLIVHERFHTGDYPFKCELCDKSYAVKSHYNYHVAKHKGVTYKCDHCDKEFMNRSSLTVHRFKHQERMPHECPICNKGFTSPYKLNRHQNVHKSKTSVTNK